MSGAVLLSLSLRAQVFARFTPLPRHQLKTSSIVGSSPRAASRTSSTVDESRIHDLSSVRLQVGNITSRTATNSTRLCNSKRAYRYFSTSVEPLTTSAIAVESMHAEESAVPPAPTLPEDLKHTEDKSHHDLRNGDSVQINGHAVLSLSERCEQVYEQVNDFLHRAPRDGEDIKRIEHARRQTRLSLDIIAEALETYR
jgi:hypothetical protein